MMMTINSR